MNANTDILDFIDGSEQLVVELGEWPSFHDDEVVAVLLQREADIGAEGGSHSASAFMSDDMSRLDWELRSIT